MIFAGYGRLHREQDGIVETREYLTKALEALQAGSVKDPDNVKEDLVE
jgi:hypothetical protein